MCSHYGLLTPPASVKVESSPRNLSSSQEQKWWNTNVPEEHWTAECPQFLKNQCEKNKHIMSIKDEEHPRLSWAKTASLIDAEDIGQFHRMPSDLRRYLKYCSNLKENYGSTLHFIQFERLKWPIIDPTGEPPFQNNADYKILCNDWPYAIDQEIVHLVIWTKFILEDNPRTGRLKDEYKTVVEEFVRNTFCHNAHGQATIDRQNLRWFKNWRSLRSVHALEHFHVMLYKPPADLIVRVTNGDRPMCAEFET